MVCAENMELETVWKRRYELASQIESGGLFAVPLTKKSHTLTVRHHRARQAQAASAILLHRQSCSICSHDHRALEAQSLAS